MGQIVLSEVPVGSIFRLGSHKIRISPTTTGCAGCIFQSEQGAKYCRYSAFCFANRRIDKRSVKFIIVEK